jgi:hypothetical protein
MKFAFLRVAHLLLAAEFACIAVIRYSLVALVRVSILCLSLRVPRIDRVTPIKGWARPGWLTLSLARR